MVEVVLRVALSLGVVLALLWATARISARRLGGGPRALVRVRGRQALSRTSSVVVVEVADRLLVVGVSDGGVRLLTELDPDAVDEPVEEPPARAPSAVTGAHPGLAGSLLAPQTWKQAWAAATRRQALTGFTVPEPVHRPDRVGDRG